MSGDRKGRHIYIPSSGMNVFYGYFPAIKQKSALLAGRSLSKVILELHAVLVVLFLKLT